MNQQKTNQNPDTAPSRVTFVQGTQAAQELEDAAKESQRPATDHALEYRTFIREVRRRDKFPIALAQNFRNNKVDLFHVWRKNGQDWGKVTMVVKRRAAKVTEALGKKQLVKVRTLVLQGMPQKKAEDLRDRKKAAGLGCFDPEFPDDMDEYQFWTTVEVSRSNVNRAEESMEAAGVKTLNDDEAEELLGEDGILGAGMQVAAPGVTDKNAASFAEGMANLLTNEGSGTVKLIKPPKAPAEAQPVEDATAKDIAKAKCEEIAKEMKDAQQFDLVMTSHDIDQSTAKGMRHHAEFMSQKYKELTALIIADAEPEEYMKHMEEIEKRQDWFEDKSRLAKKVVAHVRSSASAKPKAAKPKPAA